MGIFPANEYALSHGGIVSGDVLFPIHATALTFIREKGLLRGITRKRLLRGLHHVSIATSPRVNAMVSIRQKCRLCTRQGSCLGKLMILVFLIKFLGQHIYVLLHAHRVRA